MIYLKCTQITVLQITAVGGIQITAAVAAQITALQITAVGGIQITAAVGTNHGSYWYKSRQRLEQITASVLQITA